MGSPPVPEKQPLVMSPVALGGVVLGLLFIVVGTVCMVLVMREMAAGSLASEREREELLCQSAVLEEGRSGGRGRSGGGGGRAGWVQMARVIGNGNDMERGGGGG